MALADHAPEPRMPGDIVSRLIATLNDDDYDTFKALLLGRYEYSHASIADALIAAGLTVDGEYVSAGNIGKFRRDRKKMESLNEPR